MIVIGGSLGGMRALGLVLKDLPAKGFPYPIAAVLHRARDAETSLVELLQRDSQMPIREVTDKEPIVKGKIFLAPADYHLLVEPHHFSLSIDEPEVHARPSIDVLFDSAADIFGSEVTGVVLTGASQDGAAGAVSIKKRGGRIIVQDPSTAEGDIMPRAALKAVKADYILPLDMIGALLLKLTGLSA